MTKKRLKEIVMEAVTTSTISRITMLERNELAAIAEKITGVKDNPLCNACIIKMCYVIRNNNFKNIIV